MHNVDGRLHIARKERHHDEWDPKIGPYHPYGPSEVVTRHDDVEFIDD